MGYDPVSIHTYGELPLGRVALNLQKAVTVVEQTLENGKMSLLMYIRNVTENSNEQSCLVIPNYALGPISGTKSVSIPSIPDGAFLDRRSPHYPH